MVKELVVVCPGWPGHPDYENTNLVQGVVVVRLNLPRNLGYKKTYISEKKQKKYKRERTVAIHSVFFFKYSFRN